MSTCAGRSSPRYDESATHNFVWFGRKANMMSQPDVDVRISEDPGRYLCDFIYYSSLAHLRKQQRPGKACFFHVPAIASDAAIIRGREICVNLIRSIAESEIAERRRAAN
ncbi:hypothetical protein NLG97_g10357 [Lecanicillium saksenae]|uniref:Uncharacterized protein n=1 Tax=Lecanicillium saksenae TaxID=468837 RepID=A0ACC1QDE2_9HYPO|nr:hypothetical protein NLG97_g10357 [Lecanicillium saksenae]